MPTIEINAKATKQDGDLLFLELEYEGRTVEMTARQGMTLLEMAQLAVNQDIPPAPDIVFDGTVQITFHTETRSDRYGNETTIRIVDDVIKL